MSNQGQPWTTMLVCGFDHVLLNSTIVSDHARSWLTIWYYHISSGRFCKWLYYLLYCSYWKLTGALHPTHPHHITRYQPEGSIVCTPLPPLHNVLPALPMPSLFLVVTEGSSIGPHAFLPVRLAIWSVKILQMRSQQNITCSQVLMSHPLGFIASCHSRWNQNTMSDVLRCWVLLSDIWKTWDSCGHRED